MNQELIKKIDEFPEDIANILKSELTRKYYAPKVEKILSVTAKYYGVSVEDIKSKKKNDTVANARHIAVYVIRKLTDLPFKKIGEIVGRDHSTVMSSISKVEINIKTKKNTDSDIKKIIKEIKS